MDGSHEGCAKYHAIMYPSLIPAELPSGTRELRLHPIPTTTTATTATHSHHATSSLSTSPPRKTLHADNAYKMLDAFIDAVCTGACMIAKNRKSDILEERDIIKYIQVAYGMEDVHGNTGIHAQRIKLVQEARNVLEVQRHQQRRMAAEAEESVGGGALDVVHL